MINQQQSFKSIICSAIDCAHNIDGKCCIPNVGVKIGNMLIRTLDISAISVVPYTGYGEVKCGK